MTLNEFINYLQVFASTAANKLVMVRDDYGELSTYPVLRNGDDHFIIGASSEPDTRFYDAHFASLDNGHKHKGEKTVESYRYGVYSMHLEPTKRQQLFEEIKNKAVKCADRTQLCAAIYPWVLNLVSEYKSEEDTRRARASFRAEIYDFQRALSVHLSAIPFVVSPDSRPLDLERIRDEALEAAIEMAVDIASIEVHQISIKLSDVMARFVEDL